MFQSVEGIFKAGKIEFLEPLPTSLEGKVIVTFLSAGSIDLAERGIDEVSAAGLRHRLKSFAGDWDRPEMDAYDAI